MPDPAPAKLIELQLRFECAVQAGYIELGTNKNLHSVLFFSGLRAIAKGLVTLRKNLGGAKVTSAGLEGLSLQDRTDLILDLADVMADWPASFLKRCEGAARPYLTFTRDNASLPYWLYHVCDAELRREVPRITDEEVAYIQAHIEWLDGRFSLARSREIFGRDIAPAMSRSRRGVSAEEAEMFVADIDHRVAVAEGQERLDLLRDKVLFVTGRVLGLTQRQLTRLRLFDVDDAAANDPEERSVLVPSTTTGLQDYFAWYRKEIRPRYVAADSAPWLFLSSGPLGQMPEHLIGARFMKSVRSADMNRRIKNFAHWTYTEPKPNKLLLRDQS